MTPIQKLYELLQTLNTLLDQIVKMLEQERVTIINLNTLETEKYAIELSTLFSKIEPLNHEIATTLANACVAVSVVGNKNITTLVKFLTKPERELLTKLQASVHSRAETVNNSLIVNNSLLQDSLQFTAQSLQMFTNALRQTSNTTYGHQGRFVNAIDQPHIICKEI